MIPGKPYRIHGGGDFLGDHRGNMTKFTFHPDGAEEVKNYYLQKSDTIKRRDVKRGTVMIFISFTKLNHDLWIVTMLLGSEILSYASYNPEQSFLKDFTRVTL